MSSTTSKVVIGTRGSDLALWQAHWVADRLRAVHAGLEVELTIIRTTGDRVVDRPLADIGGKGLFVKEIEEGLLDGSIDLAVHSLKDMPVELPEGLELSAYPARAEPFDALCGRAPIATLDDLPQGAVVGTGSLRRRLQLLALRPDLDVVGLRGNVPTRLKRRFEPAPGLDAVVLAEAGVRRLGLWEDGFMRLAPPTFLPAASQGTLALETRTADARTRALVQAIDAAEARLSAVAERACLAAIDGSCHTPFAVFAERDGERLIMTARLFDEQGGMREERNHCAANLEAAAALGAELGARLLG